MKKVIKMKKTKNQIPMRYETRSQVSIKAALKKIGLGMKEICIFFKNVYIEISPVRKRKQLTKKEIKMRNS